MGEVIGQILPLIVGVALSPVPIIAVILMLFTAHARRNSIAFLVGWILGLAISGGIILVLASAGDFSGSDGNPSDTSGVIRLVLGVLFLFLAFRNWKQRPRGDETADTPGWMAAIDQFSVPKSTGMAILLSGINPKNLALTIAAATTIAAASLSDADQVSVLVFYVLLASVTVALPVIIYLIAGHRADEQLTEMKDWLIQHNHVVMAVIFLIFGVKLIGDGISILSS